MSSTRTSKTAGESKAAAEGDVPSGDVTPVITVNGDEPDTSDPKTSVPATVEGDAEIPKMSELTGIRYKGVADVKILSASDLESIAGEPAKGDLYWGPENGHLVPTKDFNSSTRNALLALPDFVAE